MKIEQLGTIKAIQGDCMEYMKSLPDKVYDLAIVDPPYEGNDAIGLRNARSHSAKRKDYKVFKNIAPDDTYFKELERVSKHQIIWGGNFFGIKGGVVAWHKHGTAFGEGEIAICSTHKSVRFFDFVWNGMLQQNMKNKQIRIHPTEKPIQLYEWLLTTFAKQGYKILDTHGGSFSHAIACHNMGFDLTIIEKDKDYYEKATQRLICHQSQGSLFSGSEMY